jgi:hypothetical protein
MTPEAVNMVKLLLPEWKAKFGEFGTLQSVEFNGITPMGINIYDVKFEHGATQWSIWLDANGKTQLLGVRPQ